MNIEILKNAVKNSVTIREVLTKMTLNQSSTSYKTLRKRFKENNIDTSHFLTHKQIVQRSRKEGKLINISDCDIFKEDSNCGRETVKKRILKNNLLPYKCILCNQGDTWKGKKLTLILDHENGIPNDNRIHNLRFVCPNCNSTLPTHCIGHKRLKPKQDKRKKEVRINLNLNREKKSMRKVVRPSKELLLKEIKELGYRGTGNRYGVSDNSIRKWAKLYNLL